VRKKSYVIELIRQFNQQSQVKFRLLRESATRFDIIPDIAGQQPILDTSVKVDDKAEKLPSGQTVVYPVLNHPE
jgi:hypothetical protein